MKVKLTLLILVLIFISCSSKPAKIVKIEHADIIWHTEYFKGWIEEHAGSPKGGYYKHERGGWNKNESFIISNPPKTKEELFALVNEFNPKTMKKDSILKYNRSYTRTFYKKTWKTKQAYKEGDYLGVSSWLDESEQNILLRISWKIYDDESGIKVSYSYYNKDSKNNENESVVKDVDNELFELK